MDKQMIKEIAAMQGIGAIYLKNRHIKAEEIDIRFFQILSDFLLQGTAAQNKLSELYYELLRYWSYCLLRTKEEELDEPGGHEITEDFLEYYGLFSEHTKDLTKKEKISLLYRFPWYARMLLFKFNGEKMDDMTIYIRKLAQSHKITDITFEDISHFAITEYDTLAIQIIHTYIQNDTTNQLDNQLTQNMHTIIHAMMNLRSIVENGESFIKEEDRHGIDIIINLFKLKEQSNLNLDFFDYMLFSLSSICFWHVETNHVKSNWMIKKGDFQFLKRHKNEKREKNA